MDSQTQEPRNEQVGAAVTESEKWVIQLVKQTTRRDVSNLLREYNLTQLIEWGQRLDTALREIEPAEDVREQAVA